MKDAQLAFNLLVLIFFVGFLLGRISVAHASYDSFITWKEGVKVVSFDAKTETWNAVRGGRIISADAVGNRNGLMYTGYSEGSGVIIYDKHTGKVKRKYGETGK